MIVGDAARYQAGDSCIRDQWQVVPVLLEAAHREDGDGRSPVAFVAGRGLRDQSIHDPSIPHHS
ncbi:hypothetical protein GCM10009753_22910 [Streptantibioticus ferralitis]